MIRVYLDPKDQTYLLSYNKLISSSWFSTLPINFSIISFEKGTEYLDLYSPTLIHSFKTIEDYHEYLDAHPEELL